MSPPPGTLFIVATPIGNLEDITYRAVKVLGQVDLIAAEDTRRTRILLNAYGVSAVLTSYHDHNKQRQGIKLLEALLSGKSIALVSDAGTPGISDPGYYLVNLAIRNGIAVIPVPGASALVAALSASGLPSDRFAFAGYLPKKRNARKKYLIGIKDEEQTVIFYESPHRILVTLQELFDICGERWTVVAREMTKVYEEMLRGPLSQVIQTLEGRKVRGEFTVLIAGAGYSEKRLTSAKDQVPINLFVSGALL